MTERPAVDEVRPVSAKSGGVSIALIGDPGPNFEMAAPSVDLSVFQPRVGLMIFGLLLIAATVALATVLGVNGTGMCVVVLTSCFLVGTTWGIHNRLRWENAANAYQRERAAAESWNARFLKLHSESTRTNTVLSHMTDGVLMLSPTTDIRLINDAARHLLGLPNGGDFLGRRFSELVRVPEIVHAVERAKSDDSVQNVSVEIVDGSIIRPVAVRVGRIQDSVPPHMLLVLTDETESLRVEAIRREFIANVSHELKTPLAAIKGYAETVELAIEDDAESAKHFIGQIEHQCKRLEDLTADMMKLARAQSGEGTLHVKTIDLQKVVQQAMVSFLPVAAAKKIELTVRSSDEPVNVRADEEAALAISQNLISNALRHTEAGGHVIVQYRKENSGWVMAVQDDGVGIAEEFQDRIFERFYRVDRTRKTNDDGTGIGLSIVKNLTRGLNGTVRVISSPGEGATFEVWLRSPE